MNPSIRLVSWEDRQSLFVFVAIPNERGRYLRTDKSVVLVPCPACKAVKGEPCQSRQGYGGMTHAIRRTRAKEMVGGSGARVDDLIEPVHPWGPEPSVRDPLPEPMPDIRVVIRPKYGAGAIALLAEPKPIV